MPMPRMRIVPDRCGSSSISTEITPSTAVYGMTPKRSVCILSRFLEILSAKNTTTASFAISEGWNEMVCVPSQRVALLRVCARGLCGIMTRISRKIAKPSRIFDAPRQRW